MGAATDAILVYGYDLGGADEGWKVQEVDEYGYLLPTSWHEPTDDEDGDDIGTAVEKQLLATVGEFTETWTRGARETGYWERRREAQKRIGVTLETYCSHSVPAYALAAHATTVHRGDVEYIDPQDLLWKPPTEKWDARLARALEALGLTPVQERPRWFLVSYGEL
ncbi:hypothetical protein QBA54_32200 [Streptomyces sp. B21-108]|uniref:hypothetical protein n=1 Tax=Streptomyces sp. B21-108 TaxID=3039419 RepID=UPI002FF438F1